jgi:hypothetical protein
MSENEFERSLELLPINKKHLFNLNMMEYAFLNEKERIQLDVDLFFFMNLIDLKKKAINGEDINKNNINKAIKAIKELNKLHKSFPFTIGGELLMKKRFVDVFFWAFEERKHIYISMVSRFMRRYMALSDHSLHGADKKQASLEEYFRQIETLKTF